MKFLQRTCLQRRKRLKYSSLFMINQSVRFHQKCVYQCLSWRYGNFKRFWTKAVYGFTMVPTIVLISPQILTVKFTRSLYLGQNNIPDNMRSKSTSYMILPFWARQVQSSILFQENNRTQYTLLNRYESSKILRTRSD
jgi:hypothetical protein